MACRSVILLVILVCGLLFTASSSRAQVVRGPYTFHPTTTSGVILGTAQIEGLSAEAGDIVAARTLSGFVAGAAEVIVFGETAYINLTIYGDDSSTGMIEGPSEGESFELFMYDASEGIELSLVDPLTGWTNTNGSPMPGYQDPLVVFNFPLVSSLPALVDLAAPQNGALGVALNPLFAWNPSDFASTYTVQVGTATTFGELVVDSTGVESTTLQVNGLAAQTTYFWRVRASNSLGDSEWSLAYGFTTGDQPLPEAPQLVLPIDGAVNQSAALSFSWSPVESAVSYVLEIAPSIAFDTGVEEIAGITGTSANAVGLSPLQTYFWRVAAVNTGGSGPWSAARSFSVAAEEIPIPILLNPSNAAPAVSIFPQLSWSPAAGVDSYDVEISLSPDGSAPLVASATVDGATTYSPGELATETTFFWRVRSRTESGTSAWSEVFSFTTSDVIPDAPELFFPADGSIDLPTTNILIWQAAPRAASYEVHLSTREDFLDAVLLRSDLTGTLLSVSDLEGGQSFFWRVRAENDAGTGGWSDTWSFTTIPALPGEPALLEPSNNAEGVSRSPVLSWLAADNATSYDIQIGLDDSFTELVFERVDMEALVLSVENLTVETTHFWRIRGRNQRGPGAWSTAYQFTTQNGLLPGAVTLSLPANGSLDVDTSPDLVWIEETLASGYHIQLALDAAFSSLVVDRTDIESTTFQATGLAFSTDHYWRVKASNSDGAGEWSSPRIFRTTSQAAPSQVALVSPEDLAQISSASVTLEWDAALEASSYQVVILVGTQPFLDVSQVQGTTLTLNNLQPFQMYSWRVRALNAEGEGPWSLTHSFTTLQSVGREEETVPTESSISSVYPNPLSGNGTVVLNQDQTGQSDVSLLNMTGQRVLTLQQGVLSPGSHELQLDAADLSPGVYLLVFRTPTRSHSRLMVVQ